jgi:hypothetical protein
MDEKIKLKAEGGNEIEAVVLSKHADRIDVVIGESIKVSLMPTRNGLAYVANVRGREITYMRSKKDVEAELAKRDPTRRKFR